MGSEGRCDRLARERSIVDVLIGSVTVVLEYDAREVSPPESAMMKAEREKAPWKPGRSCLPLRYTCVGLDQII